MEFYGVDEPDESSHGGSCRSLGMATVTTDAAGNAAAIASVGHVAPGSHVTATATNSTSEFALNVRAVQSEVAGAVRLLQQQPARRRRPRGQRRRRRGD